MKTTSEKWNALNKMLEDSFFEIEYELGTEKFYFAPDEYFTGWVVWDTESDKLQIRDEEDNVLIELVGDNLNEATLAQYLIEFVGK